MRGGFPSSRDKKQHRECEATWQESPQREEEETTLPPTSSRVMYLFFFFRLEKQQRESMRNLGNARQGISASVHRFETFSMRDNCQIVQVISFPGLLTAKWLFHDTHSSATRPFHVLLQSFSMTRILYSDRKNTSLKTGFKEEEEGHRDMKRHEPGGLFSVTVIEIREQETQHDKLDSKKVFSAKKTLTWGRLHAFPAWKETVDDNEKEYP